MSDLKENNEAIHKLALAVEGMTGKMAGIVLALGGVMTVISLVFQLMFKK